MPDLPPLRVAVAQPPTLPVTPATRAADLAANAAAHADAVLRAGARLVVFPELSLTGYVLDAAPVALDDPAWVPLTRACARTGTTALVGALVAGDDGRRHIGVVAVGSAVIDDGAVTDDGADQVGARVVYLKTHPGADEARHVAPGDGPTAVVVDGWRVGLAVCRDTGIAEHTAGTAALGVDLVVAGLVDGPDDVAVQRSRAVTIAAACAAPVAFASAAGAVGPRHGYPAAPGRSVVVDVDGVVLAEAGPEPGAVAVVDLEPSRG